MKPIAVQLYSLREYSKDDFVGVIRKVAAIGYKGVEPAGFYNLTPAEFKRIADDLGLKIYSSHTPWCRTTDDVAAAIDMAGVLGLDRVVCGYGPDDFADMDAIKRTADKVNAIGEKIREAGLILFQHNHDFEFQKIDGRLKYEIYAELATEVKFQIDAFWSANFGKNDPAEMVRKFASRMVSIHIKDGVLAKNDAPFRTVNGTLDRKVDLRPLGQGDMDIKSVVKAMPDTVNSVVVELDYCSVEMFRAIEESYRYMTENGLAQGNK
ncbi:MAG: TIM barrel protein [Victivallaceae bacterium]|nr:TIM barrel protein [Victivallaceae bacterium]